MKKLNIAMIGYGFMGRTHSNAFSQVNHFFDVPLRPVLKTICARNAERAAASPRSGVRIDRDRLAPAVERPDIDLVDIASPNDTHAEIAVAAAKAGKMVMCEKPSGYRCRSDGDGGGRGIGRVAEHGLVQLSSRSRGDARQAAHRRRPAGPYLPLSREILQDWTISADLPQGGEGLWRLDVAVAGSGVTGDLLAHCIDTAMWLNGGIDGSLRGYRDLYQKRKHNLTGKAEPVGIDDASLFLARFENGSLATFEATRYARGHKALYTLKSMASTRPSHGTCTNCTGCNISTIKTKATCAAGGACTSPTATILI